jgi:hypothetical protein
MSNVFAVTLLLDCGAQDKGARPANYALGGQKS